jgi:site-specific DNA-methyltransferase (adenine-specific)
VALGVVLAGGVAVERRDFMGDAMNEHLGLDRATLPEPYYEEPGIVIFHGDCREILPLLPKVDLVLTDPPYEISTSGGGIGGKRKYLADIRGHIDEGFDLSILASFRNWFCFCGKEQLPDMFKFVDGKRWMLITWNKPNPTPLCNNNYLPDTEYIFHCFEPGRIFGEFRDKSRYIVHPVEKNLFDHPTVKPLPVINKLINLGTVAGDTILDPFMGSGTTLRAAKDLGRFCIGIELEEKYCAIAVERLRQAVLPL